MDPDLELIEAIARGEASALNELMSRHKEALQRFAYRYTGNVVDAGEVVQETFVRAWFNAEKFRPKATVRGWLYSITANLCRDLARRQRRWGKDIPIDYSNDGDGLPLAERLSGDDTTAVQQIEADEDLERLKAAVSRLPHKLKTPFILCVLEDYSHDAAAGALGISSKAVETRIYRARNQLRKLMERQGKQ